jgi:hypothetical protein
MEKPNPDRHCEERSNPYTCKSMYGGMLVWKYPKEQYLLTRAVICEKRSNLFTCKSTYGGMLVRKCSKGTNKFCTLSTVLMDSEFARLAFVVCCHQQNVHGAN